MNENSTKNRTDRESVAGLGSIILLVVTPESRDKARIMMMETAGVLVLGNLAIVKVFRLRTKKSGGRVELGSRDWTLCCHPDWTKTSTPSTPSLHPSSLCMLLISGIKNLPV